MSEDLLVNLVGDAGKARVVVMRAIGRIDDAAGSEGRKGRRQLRDLGHQLTMVNNELGRVIYQLRAMIEEIHARAGEGTQ